ncbi:MAG: dihydrofolate reductase [Bacteroidales bacterium]|jgi:dihydrofolate reductase|nr:dihydrofolate reductase [Bacteroidales bacterium]
MKISIIVAIAKNNAIGRNNELLWHISGDLKRFKKITTDHIVIMGRNTYLSLPNHPLPNRRNIVISHIPEEDKLNFIAAEVVANLEEALLIADKENENFIIGGGMIYKQFLPIANKLYLTQVYQEYEADTFFPEIDFAQWNEISREDHFDMNPPFSYLIFEKIP